jgi:hypothetical protein
MFKSSIFTVVVGLSWSLTAFAGPGRYTDLFSLQLKESSQEACQMEWTLGTDPILPSPVLRRGASEVGFVYAEKPAVLMFEQGGDGFERNPEFERSFTTWNGQVEVETSRKGRLDDMDVSTARFGTVLQTHSAMTSRGQITRYYGRAPNMRSQRVLTEEEFVKSLELWAGFYASFFCRN